MSLTHTPEETYEVLKTYYKEEVKPYLERGDELSLRVAQRKIGNLFLEMRLFSHPHIFPYASGSMATSSAEILSKVLGRDDRTPESLELAIRSFEADFAQLGLAIKSGNMPRVSFQ